MAEKDSVDDSRALTSVQNNANGACVNANGLMSRFQSSPETAQFENGNTAKEISRTTELLLECDVGGLLQKLREIQEQVDSNEGIFYSFKLLTRIIFSPKHLNSCMCFQHLKPTVSLLIRCTA